MFMNMNTENKARFIVVDGIAGSGKSTILKEVRKWAEEQNHSVFDLAQWSKENHNPPDYEDLKEHDIFFTFEPTRSWIGSAIRFEMSRDDTPYGAEELAHAFSLDRQIMYRRLIIPALKANKIIIQDRSVSTSIVYQPIMHETITREQVMELPGNQLALCHVPHALILTKLHPEIAAERIRQRSQESKGVFADIELLRKVQAGFESTWFKELYEQNGTEIHSLDTSDSLETTIKKARELIHTILS